MSERKYYCFCEANCRFETMTKEQILAAIAEAAAGGLVFDSESAFITKVKEGNAGGFVTFWVGTTAQYNALAVKEPNCVYIKTDSTENSDLAAAIADAVAAIDTKVSKGGDTMTGTLHLKGVVLTQGVDYGDTLPAAGTAGRIFFKRVGS